MPQKIKYADMDKYERSARRVQILDSISLIVALLAIIISLVGMSILPRLLK